MTEEWVKQHRSSISSLIAEANRTSVALLDMLPHIDMREKMIDLAINGVAEDIPENHRRIFDELENHLHSTDTSRAKVVVFGGGTGLSRIIGGDSRATDWSDNPFSGLKEVFPTIRSVVCVTDDGGSTGELLKDLPLIALGDLRHVMLSSIQLPLLRKRYRLSDDEAHRVLKIITLLFNYRFDVEPESCNELLSSTQADMGALPTVLAEYITILIEQIFTDSELKKCLERPNCLGNLLIASSICSKVKKEHKDNWIGGHADMLHEPVLQGITALSDAIGVADHGVMPATTTPSMLRIGYQNGVHCTGEDKSSKARRGFPVESVYVDYCSDLKVPEKVIEHIEEADILVFAPGSLYSSLIPIFKIDQIAKAIRNNSSALKLLIANLWVQAGETDLSPMEPERKFRVSDMIRAYEKNIPGGTAGLFNEVLCLSLKDVPASVIQRYSVEDKIPIYLDREVMLEQGYLPLECGIYSKRTLAQRGVIQHDPEILADTVKVLFAIAGNTAECISGKRGSTGQNVHIAHEKEGESLIPCERFRRIQHRFSEVRFIFPDNLINDFAEYSSVLEQFVDIVWRHHDIPLGHLGYFTGIEFVDCNEWARSQRWDNVFSYYDPDEMVIKIREDQLGDKESLEIALLIALGQSLLGNYAASKFVEEVKVDGDFFGNVFHLHLRDERERITWFSREELDDYLRFARMYRGEKTNQYTRLLNGDEGFTPPGMLMGLMYAWYLDNTLATHIEYKMAVMKIPQTDLIPAQKKMALQRENMVTFFREVVFR